MTQHVDERMNVPHVRKVLDRLVRRRAITFMDAANFMACTYFWNENP